VNQKLQTRLAIQGPKRILSLDGGGIRGCVSLGFLEQIEQTIRDRTNDDRATLADYFDLIGGTSTGAIIAALLALGRSVTDITEAYLTLGTRVFAKRPWRTRVPFIGSKLYTAWSVAPLEALAKELFSEKTTLASPAFETGLCIVTKRADTFSTWPYLNHPKGRFYPENADIPLWKLIRASSAAPTYFKPIRIDVGSVGKPDYGVFVDGGVSMANNPALQLVLVATLKGYPFNWPTGAEGLLLVSIGTGRYRQQLDENDLLQSENLYWARNVPELLMADASEQCELVLQYLSNSMTAREIDWQVGTLADDLIGGVPQLTYLRYNAVLDREPLAAVGLKASERELASLRDMSAGTNANRLYEIGKAFAKQQFDPKHLPPAFDLKRQP
jgi:patatin-like phospholipase/acyl hydrolase